MKKVLLTAVAALTVGMLLSWSDFASAQSDRTLGISCTVAGHEHCGETGRRYGYGHHYRHYRHYR
jgi:hypothetical protein